MQDWHEWRAAGIGASDAAVIMKKFPFGKTPNMLWEEKVNMIRTYETPAMSHGKLMEPKARVWFENKIGISLQGDVRVEHPKMNWMRATLDGLDESKKIMVEIKSPYNIENHEKTKSCGKVPDIYFDQVQHQMKVMELDNMYFVSYNHKNEEDSIILEVKRDDEYIERLVNEEYEFFQKVVNLTPPELTRLDYKERGEDWIKIAKERIFIREQMSVLTKKDKELYKSLIETSEGVSSWGENMHFTKYSEKGRVDYDAAINDFMTTLNTMFPNVKLPSIDFDCFRKDPIIKWKLT